MQYYGRGITNSQLIGYCITTEKIGVHAPHAKQTNNGVEKTIFSGVRRVQRKIIVVLCAIDAMEIIGVAPVHNGIDQDRPARLLYPQVCKDATQYGFVHTINIDLPSLIN